METGFRDVKRHLGDPDPQSWIRQGPERSAARGRGCPRRQGTGGSALYCWTTRRRRVLKRRQDLKIGLLRDGSDRREQRPRHPEIPHRDTSNVGLGHAHTGQNDH